MEDKIIEVLTNNDSLLIEDLTSKLGYNSVDQIKQLLKELNELESQAKIYKSNKNKYMLFSKSHYFKGTLSVNKKGFGFVIIDDTKDNDIYIDSKNLFPAINGDLVIVEMINKEKKEGKVVRVVKRQTTSFIGEFYYKAGKGYLKLDDPKIKMEFIIDSKDSLGAMNGHKVIVKTLKNINGNKYYGKVVKVIGHKNDPGVDILSIACKYAIEYTFNDDVMKEVEVVPEIVIESEMKNRKDLRNKQIFTIDGDDTKDIDDAISIEKLDNGNYKLGVHIADVSYYVKQGSAIYKTAETRGTSCYLADRVIPMLPHKLSNGICSLNPNVDRLSITCEMVYNDQGKLIDYDIYESVINSKIQMTYNKVNDILENNIVDEEYKIYENDIYLMNELANILRKMKNDRGYIEFESSEVKIVVDKTGKAIDIKPRIQRTGERLIEDFMIAANETVATHIFNMELPFIYRTHGKPLTEKIEKFIKTLSLFCINIKGKHNEFTPKIVKEIMEEIKVRKESKILSSMLLRVMQKAVYSTNNQGHYGLGSSCYTHFTSPIRRFPDTMVHHLLRTYLFMGNLDNKTINYWEEQLPLIALHSSERERASVECEREVTDMKMAEYMEGHIGEEFNGIISSVMSFGLFIELDNLVEGLVHISELKDDHYIYDENYMMLKGQNTNKIYKLGDELRIKVIGASKEAKTIDFAIVKEPEKVKS